MADTHSAARAEEAWNGLDDVRAEFVSFCDVHGYKDRVDPVRRVIDLAAAFVWLDREGELS